ncbi:MAG: hypothetical protein A3C47_04735 [Omnitrophica bacterium RIFCSPHIGHO2_02_FULL_51_18]|nr:MAG: hypothetical protein A3C47_04735 [Omnitrophica bacterium RIFCSPHIGHO2_02_FULL_51_18]
MEEALQKAEREREFHNEWARSIHIDSLLVRESFESPTAIENQYALAQLGDLRGKRVLDLGCGAGENAVYLALQGAEVSACDIAEEFLKVAETLAKKFNVNLRLARAEVGNLPYADGHFDFVFGNGVLHHVDLKATAREVARVLKSAGKAVFIEPLPYNPVINLYRHMAKGVRTQDEKPLTFKQIREFGGFFSSLRHEEFWLFSLAIFGHFYFVRRWNPSKVRYWKKVIEEGAAYADMFRRLQRWDHFFLKYAPFLKPLCWNTVLVVQK